MDRRGLGDPLEEIESLVAFASRAPGTDAERRAADDLGRRLVALGRRAEVEPFRTWPRTASVHLLHVVLALLGTVVSVFAPVTGLVLVAVALLSTLLDLTGRAHLARRLTPSRASQNVLSAEGRGRPGTLVLVAHHDAGPTPGPIASAALAGAAALTRALRLPLGPSQLLVAVLIGATVCAGLRIPIGDHVALAAAQFALASALLLAGALLAGIAVAPTSPGANDNASGVATALRLAERYGNSLEHFDLWVLLSGADAGGLLGASAFVRAHRRELDPERTAFLGIDRVGAGTVRYARREGLLRRRRYYRPLVELCDELAADEALARTAGARPVAPAGASSVHAAARRGYPAVAISCAGPDGRAARRAGTDDVPERIELEALERAFAFCAELVERIDRQIGPVVAGLPAGRSSRRARRRRRAASRRAA